MPLPASEIVSRPNFHDEVRRHARALLEIHEQYPRISSVFATEQRAMLGNIAFKQYFESNSLLPRRGILLARYLDAVEASGVASRNTADSFIKGMLKYGYLRTFEVPGDKRLHPLEPTETAITAFIMWLAVHLDTLDALDGGERIAVLGRNSDLVADIHVEASSNLLGDGAAAEYSQTLALFAWVNNSKLLTLRLLAGVGDVEAGATRVSTDLGSIVELADWLGISRSHLTRKMREAEEMGSLGWEGKRDKSPLWISTGFLKEMTDECAARLAILDAACAQLLPASGSGEKRE